MACKKNDDKQRYVVFTTIICNLNENKARCLNVASTKWKKEIWIIVMCKKDELLLLFSF